MNRRIFLAVSAFTAAAAVVPPAGAASERGIPYSREAYEQALASGEPFLMDFYTEW